MSIRLNLHLVLQERTFITTSLCCWYSVPSTAIQQTRRTSAPETRSDTEHRQSAEPLTEKENTKPRKVLRHCKEQNADMVILNLSFRRWLRNGTGNRREGEKVPLQALPRVPPQLLHQQRPSQISLLITSKPAGVSCQDCLPITVRSRECNADLQTSTPNFMVDFHGGGRGCRAWRPGAARRSAYCRDGQGARKSEFSSES